MMNSIRFTDWQGRLTCLYPFRGPAQNFHFRESAFLIAGVRADGFPIAEEDQENIYKLGNMMNPAGVVAKELVLQQQRVFGNHGSYCRIPQDYRYTICANSTYLPTTCLQSIEADISPILISIGRAFHVLEKDLYSLRLYRQCVCPSRKIVVTTGDIIGRNDAGSGEIIHEQIMFSHRTVNAEHPFEYIARRCVIYMDDASQCRYFTQGYPAQYEAHPLTKDLKIIPAAHACSELTCVVLGQDVIEHSAPPANTGDKFVLLDRARAYPPRRG